MADFKHKDKRQVSREDAAEQLAAIAGALRTGGTVELEAGGQMFSIQVTDQVLLEREYEQKGGRVEFELELSWAVSGAAAPAPGGR
jgi:amphi-Trp domain-containing protein